MHLWAKGVDISMFHFHSQLRYDGFESIASTLAKVVNIISACPPMARLHQVVNLGIQAEAEGVTLLCINNGLFDFIGIIILFYFNCVLCRLL